MTIKISDVPKAEDVSDKEIMDAYGLTHSEIDRIKHSGFKFVDMRVGIESASGERKIRIVAYYSANIDSEEIILVDVTKKVLKLIKSK